jgi:hypothetical protein
MPPYCRCHSDMYDDIRLHYGPAVTSQLFWLAPLSDEILDVSRQNYVVTIDIIKEDNYGMAWGILWARKIDTLRFSPSIEHYLPNETFRQLKVPQHNP